MIFILKLTAPNNLVKEACEDAGITFEDFKKRFKKELMDTTPEGCSAEVEIQDEP